MLRAGPIKSVWFLFTGWGEKRSHFSKIPSVQIQQWISRRSFRESHLLNCLVDAKDKKQLSRLHVSSESGSGTTYRVRVRVLKWSKNLRDFSDLSECRGPFAAFKSLPLRFRDRMWIDVEGWHVPWWTHLRAVAPWESTNVQNRVEGEGNGSNWRIFFSFGNFRCLHVPIVLETMFHLCETAKYFMSKKPGTPGNNSISRDQKTITQ